MRMLIACLLAGLAFAMIPAAAAFVPQPVPAHGQP